MLGFLRYQALLLVVLLGLARGLMAQTLDPTFTAPEIYKAALLSDAAQQPNGQYVVAGTFTRANGQASNTLTRLDATGAVDQTFRQNLSSATLKVQKLYPMTNGQLLVQGDYQAGAVQRHYLFRLNADGTLDASFTLTFPGPYPYPAVTQAIVQPDGRVLVMGYFSSSNTDLIRLLSDGSRDPSFSVALTSFSQDTKMLLQADGKIIVAGSISRVNGQSAFFLARLNTDGSTDTSYQPQAYTNARLYLNDIALDASGALLVGGYSGNVVGGQPRAIFRLLPSGALDTGFSLAPSLAGRNCNRLVVQPGGQVLALFDAYVTGASTGLPFSSQLVRLLPTGSLDATFQQGTGPDRLLTEMRSLPNGGVLTWGDIQNFAGQRRALALLQPSGALDPTFAPLLQTPGKVRRIVRQADGKLVLVGDFNTISGHLTDGVACLLPTGQPDLTFATRQPTSAATSITTVAVQSTGQVLIAGSEATGATGADVRQFFSRLTAAGLPDASFVPAITLNQAALTGVWLLGEQASGQIVVGGSFTDAAGKANLTRLTTTGSVDPTFTPPANQPAIWNGRVLATGEILSVAPAPGSTSYPYSQGIQRLLATGQPDPAFSYTPLAPGPDISLGAVYPLPAGGYVTTGVYSTGQVMARLSATGASLPGFAAPFYAFQGPADSYSGINVVAPQSDGRLLVGGTLRLSQAYPYNLALLARLEATGQLGASFSTAFISLLTSPSSTSISEVNDLLIQPDGKTLVGGYFLEAGGQPATGLIQLAAPTALAATPSQRSSAEIQAWPIPAHDALHVTLAAAHQPQRVALLDALGRTVLTQPVEQSKFTLSTNTLRPGLYLLRVEYADGLATRAVAVE